MHWSTPIKIRPRNGRLLALAALTGLAITGPARAQTNLLVNPGFESPYNAVSGSSTVTGNVANGWNDNTSWNPAVTIAYSQDTSTFHGGSSSQKAVISAGYAQVAQWMNFSAGYTTASIWLKAQSPMWITVELAQAASPYADYGDQSYRIGTSWTKVTMTGFTPAIAGGLLITTQGTGTIWFDDGSLQFYGNNPQAQTFTPPTTAVPRAYFGLHVLHWLYEPPADVPWPPFDFGTTRSQDEVPAMWADIETSRGVYNWATMDGWVAACQSHNCAISYCGRETPSWATTDTRVDGYGYTGGAGVPTSMSDWQTFCSALATRYKGKIASYEVWNEPNYSFWDGTPAQMAQMEQAMATAVHAADPAAIVVSAPTAVADLASVMSWEDQYLAAGGGSWADAIGFHAYNSAPEVDAVTMNAWRNMLTVYGLQNKPQYNTETGWGFSGGQSMNDTIAFVGRAYVTDWGLGISRFNWYAYSDASNVGVRQDGNGNWTVLTPGAVAYEQAQNWLIGSVMTAFGSDTNGNYIAQINETNGYQGWIVWNPFLTPTYTVPSGVTRMRDLQGNITTPGATITVTSTPVLLEKPATVNGPVSINCGGPAASPFVADADFTGGFTATNNTGAVDTSAVTSPAPVAVYQDERWGAFTYTVPGLTANASYKVRLHFTEDYDTAAGQRLQNVTINSTQLLTNYDIYAAAGAQHKANIQQFTVNANGGGQMVISFAAATGSPDTNAKVDGIEVLATVPAPPAGLSAAGGNTQVALSWNASTGATSYNVKRSTVSGSGYATVASPTTTSYTNTGLTNGTIYYYVVTAVSSGGESANSSQVSATPAPVLPVQINTGGPAVAPFVADVDFSGGATATNWTGTIDTSAVTSPAPQAVYQSERYGFPAMTYTIPGLVSGANYTVRLHFCENIFTATAQRVFSVAINSTTILTNFDIYAATGAIHKANVQQFNTTGNASGQIVIAFTNVTNNALINGIEVQNLAAPAPPTGLTATPGNAQVALSWNASTGATAYDVKRSTVSGSGYVTVSSPTTTNYTNTGLANGTTYYFVVDAKNAGGTSANSSQASATPVAPPAAPTGLAATPGNTLVALSWTASSGATAYDVKRSTVSGSGYVTVSSPTTTSYTNTGLTNSTTYYFVVDAKNAGGTSGNSAQVSATPIDPNVHAGTWALKGVMQVTPTYLNTDQFPTGIAANQTYTASFWLKGTGSVAFQIWSGSWGTLLKNQTFIATGTWTQCSYTFSTGSNTQLSYIFEDPGGTAGAIYIDDCFMGILNGTNVLTNPGFESGATGWNIDAGSPWSIVQNP